MVREEPIFNSIHWVSVHRNTSICQPTTLYVIFKWLENQEAHLYKWKISILTIKVPLNREVKKASPLWITSQDFYAFNHSSKFVNELKSHRPILLWGIDGVKYILKSMLQQAVAIHFENQIPLILAYRRRYIKLSMKRIHYLQKEGIRRRF